MKDGRSHLADEPEPAVDRARKDHAPGNLARLRRFALNVCAACQPRAGLDPRQDQSPGWDDNFLLSLLATG
jgi:hypothetical protein